MRVHTPSDQPADVILELQVVELLTVEEIRGRYVEEVEYADRQIGAMLDALRARGVLDDAVVIVTSDHGEGLGDHGLTGHIDQLYDSLLHVPLVVWAPDRIPAGLVVEEPVSLVDVFPTLADLAGLDAPASAVGRSLLPLMRNTGPAVERSPFIAATFRPEARLDVRAVLIDGFKLIRTRDAAGTWHDELYDLATDPAEVDDLAATDPERVEHMTEILDRVVVSAASGDPTTAQLTDAEIEQLRALGYLRE